MKIGVANTKNVRNATHCVNYKEFVPNGQLKKFDLNCSNNNVGRYFYLYRNTNAYRKDIMNFCEVILEAYPVIGKQFSRFLSNSTSQLICNYNYYCLHVL